MLHPNSRFLDHVEGLEFLEYYGNKDTIKMYLQLLFKWHGLLRWRQLQFPSGATTFYLLSPFFLGGLVSYKANGLIYSPPNASESFWISTKKAVIKGQLNLKAN